MSTDVDSARLFGERKVKSRVLFSFSFFFSLLGNEIFNFNLERDRQIEFSPGTSGRFFENYSNRSSSYSETR